MALAAPATCATTPASPNAAKYPPRPNGCTVRVFYSPFPGVKEWDDLGMAHVECPLDVGAQHCLRKLRMEACRMGGDLLYDVPKKALRPSEQGMVYQGHVAHTRVRSDEPGADPALEEKDDQSPADAGPVQPIEPIEPAGRESSASPAPDASPSDGGASLDAGGARGHD